MFNFQGQEIFIIFVLALIVLGPERLPEAMRKLGSFVAEIRNMAGGFQQEFKAVVDEPMRQLRESADMIREQTDIRKWQSDPDTPSTANGTGSTSSDQPSEPAAPGAVGVPPVVSNPTAHVPTFDTPAATDTGLVGSTDAFAAVRSPGTELRESTARPTDSAPSDSADDLPAVPISNDSQLLRDLQFARQAGPGGTASDTATDTTSDTTTDTTSDTDDLTRTSSNDTAPADTDA